MPTIPSGTKFMGVNPDVNTDERRSSLSNSYQEFYTIDDIVAEASAADTNIYNSDGTLDANRTVDLDSKELIFDNGSVGINVNPSTALHVNALAVPAGEAVARFGVTDSSGYVQIANGTGTNNVFLPLLQGRQIGTSLHSAVGTEGIIDPVDDTGTTPITLFKARLSDFTSPVTRPLFQFTSWTFDLMTMLANGNVGIGTTTPTAKLEVNGPAFPGIESVAKFTVADDLGSSLQIKNGTNAAATFIPEIIGTNSTNRPALGISGIATTDTGTEAVTIFQSLLASATAVVTRPIFQWKNFSTNVMTMLANGNVGIGTTTPGEKLEVNGKTKTTTFQLTTTPTAGYVLTSDASGNGTWSAAAGGLTEFTEAETTAAPNATVPVNSLTPLTATTNADIAIVPKGNGAILAVIPDNTIIGGNKRGQYAVDFSMGDRDTADRVASGLSSFQIGRAVKSSGNYSMTLGNNQTTTGNHSLSFGNVNNTTGANSLTFGSSCTTSGSNSLSFGGSSTASGSYALSFGLGSIASGTGAIAIGESNTASSNNAFAIGAYCTASNVRSIAMGYQTTASGYDSIGLGRQANTFGIQGRLSHSSGRFTTIGDSQLSKFLLQGRTTNDTATTLVCTWQDLGSTPGTTNQVILSNQSAYRFKGTIVGKQSGSVNASVWDIDGFIVRGANAAATTLNISNVTLVQNTPAWGTPTLAADTTNGGLRLQVIGAAATNIQWTATIETTEVIYA